MKKNNNNGLLKKACALVLLLSVIGGCEKMKVQPDSSPNFTNVGASSAQMKVISDWFDSGINKLPSEYSISRLRKLTDLETGASVYSILSAKNSNFAINFILNENGKVGSIFRSKTKRVSSDQIMSSILILESNVQFTYVDNLTTHTRQMIFSSHEEKVAGRIDGFFSRWDDCVGKFHNLTKSNIANIVIDVVFDAATLGLYTAISIPFCAAAAGLSGDGVENPTIDSPDYGIYIKSYNLDGSFPYEAI